METKPYVDVVFEREKDRLVPKRIYVEGETLVMEWQEVHRCTIEERLAVKEGFPKGEIAPL